MFVKPAEGRSPRDPRTLLRIPREGIEVSEHDPSFATLRRHGDLVEDEPPAPVSEVAAERAGLAAETETVPDAAKPLAPVSEVAAERAGLAAETETAPDAAKPLAADADAAQAEEH